MSGCSLRFNDDLGDKLRAMYPGVECVMNFSMARIEKGWIEKGWILCGFFTKRLEKHVHFGKKLKKNHF